MAQVNDLDTRLREKRMRTRDWLHLWSVRIVFVVLWLTGAILFVLYMVIQ